MKIVKDKLFPEPFLLIVIFALKIKSLIQIKNSKIVYWLEMEVLAKTFLFEAVILGILSVT